MPWVQVFAVFVVSHVVGDYIFQTEWQALNKHGGLTGSPTMRRALVSHIATYTLAFLPALIWLYDPLSAGVFGVALLIAIPHLIQDDGRLLVSYASVFKKADITTNLLLGALLDQAFHLVALFLAALAAGS